MTAPFVPGDRIVPNEENKTFVTEYREGVVFVVTSCDSSENGYVNAHVEGDPSNHFTGYFSHRFEKVESDPADPFETIGSKFIVGEGHGAGSFVIVGDTVTLTRAPGPSAAVVRVTNDRNPSLGEFGVFKNSLTPVGGSVETLESFKERFLTLAVRRAAENGGAHPGQVKDLLDEFARAEFLTPTTDLDEFKKKVVALAFEGKKRHRWCPEPERFLRDLGLSALLPVVKTIQVVVEVEVTGESDWVRSQWRDAARQAVLDKTDTTNTRVPVSAIAVSNDIL